VIRVYTSFAHLSDASTPLNKKKKEEEREVKKKKERKTRGFVNRGKK
jgi:hypothetical protein